MKIRLLFFLLILPSSLFAQYPMIRETSAFRDSLFKQQQRETESWYFNDARGKPSPPLSIYRYKPEKNDSLIMLAASFNLPVDTLATINGLENIRDFSTDEELLIPSAPGLYLHNESDSAWMQTLRDSLLEKEGVLLKLNINNKKKEVLYYQGLTLPPKLKTRFILPLFHSPLQKRIITSPYGYRNHPVTGIWGLHGGTDYRVPTGSSVYSCADGTILSVGELEDYGKYIIIGHRNGYTSLYSHLNKILVVKDQKILEAQVIAESGNTGISTGPHLHFEIRRNGRTADPENLLLRTSE